MPARNWKTHTGRWLFYAAVVGFAGWMSGHLLISLAVAAAAAIGWHLANVLRLYCWLPDPRRKPPKSFGIWAEIFGSIHSMEKRHDSRSAQYEAEIGKFSSLTNAFPEAMLALDASGAITWCNAAAVPLLGIRIPEDYGRHLSSLVRDPDFAAWLNTESGSETRLDIAAPGGKGGWLTVSAFPFQDNFRLIILRNITAIHNLDQIRRDFVANISHELRTPLTVLRGYLEMLQDHPLDEISEPVDRMLGPALQMQTLLDDLLELSRLQSMELRDEDGLVDVPATLRQLHEQANGLSRGSHQINFEINPSLFLWGVAADLESAFSNLITNAIKYTPQGGSITVTWEQGIKGPELHVIDTGIGIPNPDIPRVTERFYRVGSDRARETGGTGLGLAIVKHVLNAHLAQLTIISELGLGSKFICAFPGGRARVVKPDP